MILLLVKKSHKMTKIIFYLKETQEIVFFVKIDLVENVKRVSNNRIFLDSFWNFLKFLAIVLVLKYTSEIFLLKKLQNYISIGSFR